MHGVRAQRAFDWFLGRNRLGRPLYDFATGGCCDGLGESDVNANEGAESTLAFHRAQLVLDAAGPPRVVRVADADDRLMTRAPELFRRHPGNPLLTAADWPTAVNVVFNPAAVDVGGETVLLARVEARTGISHLTVARSANGVDGWHVEAEPLLAPIKGRDDEQWGFEDARAVWVEELGRYVITCTAYGPAGPAVFLATTEDFRSVERHRDRRRARGQERRAAARARRRQWILFHRPTSGFATARAGIALSRSSDLRSWSAPEVVMQPRAGAWWDSLRIGIGPPLLKTEHGWLLVYHGVKETVGGAIYRVGLALLDLEEPTRVLRRTSDWVLAPCEPYERQGDVPNALFPCGLIHDRDSGELRLYYGAADTSICLATASYDDVIAAVLGATTVNVKVAVLGAIAWRTPPRAYGPWERVAGLIAAGLHRARRRRDALRDARLGDACEARRRPPDAATPRTRRSTAASGRRCMWPTLSSAPPSSTSSTTTSTGCRSRSSSLAQRSACDHDPRLLGTGDHAGLPGVELGVRLDLAGRPRAGARLRRQRLPRRRQRRAAVRPGGGDSLVSFGRIHPDKGTAEAIEIAARAGRRLVICGIVHDEAYFRERVEPHDRRRPGHLPRLGRPRRARACARQRGGAPAPGRLRRAVRTLGRRVDDVRHACDRVRTRLDGGDRRRRADGLPRLERRRGRGRRRAAAGSTAPSAGRSRWSASPPTRMVDDYLRVYAESASSCGSPRRRHRHRAADVDRHDLTAGCSPLRNRASSDEFHAGTRIA